MDSDTGEEISNPRKICKQYLKGRFWMDLLSTIPFDLFLDTEGYLQFLLLFGLLKVMRVTRLTRIINFMNVKDDVKMTLKIFKLVFFLILYIHFVGCGWYFIVKGPKNWIA